MGADFFQIISETNTFCKYMDSYGIIFPLHTLFCVRGAVNKQAPLQMSDLTRGACHKCA